MNVVKVDKGVIIVADYAGLVLWEHADVLDFVAKLRAVSRVIDNLETGAPAQ